ncbi:MAG: hypothetical protein K6B74_10860 [Ruminococcus sp.]|nr:hypothetical protein [Ruminococcus sp.]
MSSFYVKAFHDNEDTGGYYLLFSKNFDDPQAEGYDEWYPDLEDLTRRINSLDVEWIS